MTRPILAAALCAAALPVPHGAGLAQTAQPYAGEDTREIAGLSSDRIAGLRAGAGLSYALSAELNGWPGPVHVLELADALALDRDTIAEVEGIRASMLAEAIVLGEALINAEAALDALFSEDAPAPDAIAAATAEVGRLDAALRAAHLAAHLQTRPLLSRHQLVVYAEARGYLGAETGQAGHAGPSGHSGHSTD